MALRAARVLTLLFCAKQTGRVGGADGQASSAPERAYAAGKPLLPFLGWFAGFAFRMTHHDLQCAPDGPSASYTFLLHVLSPAMDWTR